MSRRALHLEVLGGLYAPSLPLEVSGLPRLVRGPSWPALTADDARFAGRLEAPDLRGKPTRQSACERPSQGASRAPSRKSPSKTGGERP